MKRMFLILAILGLVGCKTTAPIVTPTVHTDSVRTSNTHDSIRVYERDSVFIDRYIKADTIYLTKEKWSIKYRDREVAVHDTIYQTQKETEVVQVKYTPPFYKVCTGSFLLLVLFWVVVFVVRKTLV